MPQPYSTIADPSPRIIALLYGIVRDRERILQHIRGRKYYAANRDKDIVKSRKYYADNHDRALEARRKYRADNIEKIREVQRKHYADNRDRALEVCRKYRIYNPEKHRAKGAARRAGQGRATPSWVDRAAILEVYKQAKRFTEETGILHHVDHIVPLRGKTVCGLHVPWNLRPLPAAENMRKGNKLIAA